LKAQNNPNKKKKFEIFEFFRFFLSIVFKIKWKNNVCFNLTPKTLRLSSEPTFEKIVAHFLSEIFYIHILSLRSELKKGSKEVFVCFEQIFKLNLGKDRFSDEKCPKTGGFLQILNEI
jgi:hypothetical protein